MENTFVDIHSIERDDRHSSEVSNPCYLCGRETEARKSTRYIEVGDGGTGLFRAPSSEADRDDSGYMGWHPVGPVCAKKAKAAGARVLTEATLEKELGE